MPKSAGQRPGPYQPGATRGQRPRSRTAKNTPSANGAAQFPKSLSAECSFQIVPTDHSVFSVFSEFLPLPARDTSGGRASTSSAARPSHPSGEVFVWRGRDIALRCPRRVQRRNTFECHCRSDLHSARYYASGDGAARRPYHRAKHIPGEEREEERTAKR